jgi:hypothetical protein
MNDNEMENSYKSKCVAIKKFKQDNNNPNTVDNLNYKVNLRCKSRKQHNSIFCGVHKKHKPALVTVVLKTVNNIKEWLTIPFTNEKDIIVQIKKIKDDFEKEILDKIAKEIEILNSITICKVCCDSVISNSELIRCTKATSENKHLVCSNCILGHVDSLISDGIASYCCMFNKADKCGGEYSISDISKVISITNSANSANSSKQLQWEELINISEIFKLASICDDYVICPFVVNGDVFLKSHLDIKVIFISLAVNV